MKQLVIAERSFLIGHILSMAFGLAGLLIVLPNAEILTNLGSVGQQALAWSMAYGGVAYMLMGTAAVAIYAYRTLGVWHAVTFFIPAVSLSLGSELLGTSTGFPFGDYGYLSGLGYKIAGLVPFTIPLSWFYLGFVSYLLARCGLEGTALPGWLRQVGAIALGAMVLTCWDFVLDPAMTQTVVPFWQWGTPGAFFGMPYQNFAGWFGTGALFMSVAALFWQKAPLRIERSRLTFPLVMYLSNFAFSAIMSMAFSLWIPVLLGLVIGVAPVLLLWWMADTSDEDGVDGLGASLPATDADYLEPQPSEMAVK